MTVAVHTPAELTVMADPDRLRQAVDNLLDNATRHAPSGSVVEITATANGTGMIVVEVADRGPGFPVDFLPDAFERFHRADAARTRDGGGTGLGLSIVQAITEAHGGHASVGNRPGGGATVTLELPDTDGGSRSRGARWGAPDLSDRLALAAPPVMVLVMPVTVFIVPTVVVAIPSQESCFHWFFPSSSR